VSKNSDAKAVTRYWLAYYADEHCTLCGNYGIIDTRGTVTPSGVLVGRLNWCICPNGQACRESEEKHRLHHVEGQS
jgi:hypothetical protein